MLNKIKMKLLDFFECRPYMKLDETEFKIWDERGNNLRRICFKIY